jgi:amidase
VPKWQGEGDQFLSYQLMWAEGPLVRTVGDARLALAAMSKPQPLDPFYAAVPLNGEPLKRPIRVGLLRDVGVVKPDPAVNQALDQAAALLTDAGYVVEEVELPLLHEAYTLWYLLALEEIRQVMPQIEEVGDEGMKVAARYYYENAKQWWGAAPTITDYMNGYARRGTLINQLQQFLQDHPLLLLPVSAEQAFPQDLDLESVEANMRIIRAQWSLMAVPVLGFPGISVPTGVVNGLPVGVQILGRKFREDTLLDAADVIQSRTGVITPIDPR